MSECPECAQHRKLESFTFCYTCDGVPPVGAEPGSTVNRILQWHEDEEARLRHAAERPWSEAGKAQLISKARWHKEARKMVQLLADSADCMCDGGGSTLHTHNPERCTVVRP